MFETPAIEMINVHPGHQLTQQQFLAFVLYH